MISKNETIQSSTSMEIENFLTHHARESKSKQEALVELLQRASTDKQAKKFCKAMIRAKLKKSEFGRQLLIGRQLYKKRSKSDNETICAANKSSIEKYLQHRAARRLASISFNNMFSIGSDELATKLKSTSYYGDANANIQMEKSCPKSIGMLLQRISTEENSLKEEDSESSSTCSSSIAGDNGPRKLPLSQSIPSLKEAHATLDENNQKLSQLTFSTVPISEGAPRKSISPVNHPRAA